MDKKCKTNEIPDDLDLEELENRGIQQDDNYREFMSWITDGGLRYAFAKRNGFDDFYQKQVDQKDRRKVIIVGAGMSGLAAAYELAQTGHQVLLLVDNCAAHPKLAGLKAITLAFFPPNTTSVLQPCDQGIIYNLKCKYRQRMVQHVIDVTILEAQSHVGGRVKTLKEGFKSGFYGEGAMRLPYNHFLTRHYIKMFNIDIKKFQNFNENAFMSFNGDPPITMSDWLENEDHYCSKYWPGWDAKLVETKGLKHKLGVKGIRDYFSCSIEKIKLELGKSPSEEMWHAWIKKWSKFSLEEYLRSDIFQTADEPQLRPWPDAAIKALEVSTSRPMLEKDLVLYLRVELGKLWDDPMYTPTFGMDELPKAFLKKNENGWNKNVNLSTNLRLGIMVKKVENIKRGRGKNVKVTGFDVSLGKEEHFYADAVFLTVPVQALRRMETPISMEQKNALENVAYIHATKIMLQCKSRFWQKSYKEDRIQTNRIQTSSKHGIVSQELQGGFSITDQQICRLFYPDHTKSGIKNDDGGILTAYTFQDNAIALGSETEEKAIDIAISQISKIHPEIKHEFDKGMVQAWQNEQTTLCAFAILNPLDNIRSLKILSEPSETIYIAGDTLSWSNLWIQGAIFSGLFQAFCFQSKVEGSSSTCNPVTFLL